MKYLFVLLSLLATPAFAAAITPEDVQKEIDIHSPRAAMKMYFKCEESVGYDHVAQGSKPWLAVAVQMLPYLNGCYAAQMTDAFAHAMLNAPKNMLHYLNTDPKLSAQKICLPNMSDWSSSKKLDYLNQLEPILKSVDDNQLRANAAACLDLISSTREKLK